MDSTSQQFYGNPNIAQPYIGGYPYGYPPVQQQNIGLQTPFNPFAQQQFQMPVPGTTTPLEITNHNGETFSVPPQQQFVQGGTTISQGGFNPVTGVITPSVSTTGFNPYTRVNQGFSPYYPPPNQVPFQNNCNPFIRNGNLAYNQMQDVLYHEDPVSVDIRSLLTRTVLSDSDQERFNIPQIIRYDYYGRPLYDNQSRYQIFQQQQKEFEKQQKSQQQIFVRLAQIVCSYNGKDMDEETIINLYFPQPQVYQERPFDSLTDEEKREYERRQKLIKAQNTYYAMQQYKEYEKLILKKKEEVFAQIKASHDKLLGVTPGENYGLTYFLDHGYRIRADIATRKARLASRNGTRKYSQNNYRAGLSQLTNSPVPTSSKDDEYISVEDRLKEVYNRNRRMRPSFGVMKDVNGQITYTSGEEYEQAFPSEYAAHNYFLQAIQNKKEQNDAIRAVT